MFYSNSWQLQYLYYFELIEECQDAIKYDMPKVILAPILASDLNPAFSSASRPLHWPHYLSQVTQALIDKHLYTWVGLCTSDVKDDCFHL